MTAYSNNSGKIQSYRGKEKEKPSILASELLNFFFFTRSSEVKVYVVTSVSPKLT